MEKPYVNPIFIFDEFTFPNGDHICPAEILKDKSLLV
jgi:hypothetical protein